jgi:hypothetical protein
MGGNGCSCDGGTRVEQMEAPPDFLESGRRTVVWNTMTFDQTAIAYSQAMPVSPNDAFGILFILLNFDTGATGTGQIQMSTDGIFWVSAGSFNVNALGATYASVTGITGCWIRIAYQPQAGKQIGDASGYNFHA